MLQELHRSQDSFEQCLPVGEKKYSNNFPQTIPHTPLAAKLHPALLIQRICKLKYLVSKEGKKIQEKKVHRKMPLTMSIIVLYIIPLIL